MHRFLGPLRPPLRSAFFSLLEQALATDDGKRAVVNSLGGLLNGGRQSISLPDGLAPPYPDLGRCALGPTSPPPVFITARFRSGSTLLWNLFRQLPDCTAYYEPLNERRWFDPSTRGIHVDATHHGVTDYWSEYDGLSHLARWYQVRWIDRDLYMDHRSWDPDLFAYIRTLITAAPRRAVLQFNRVDFRLPWLRHHFPDARVIHLYRHPRDQWCSTLMNPARVPVSYTIEEFAAHDHYYLLNWARDLCHVFPFLDPRRAEHPYDIFYMMWKLSWIFGRRFAHGSFCFEHLCEQPAHELPRLMAAAGVRPASLDPLRRLIGAVPPRRWHAYAPRQWFHEREAHCETVLQQALRRADAWPASQPDRSREAGVEEELYPVSHQREHHPGAMRSAVMSD